MKTRRFARAIARMLQIARAIAMIPQFAEGDRDDTAIGWEQLWWYRELQERSRWYRNLLRVIAMIQRFAESDCDETSIHWEQSRWYCKSQERARWYHKLQEQSRWYCNLLRAIAMIPQFAESDRDDTAICWEWLQWNRNLVWAVVMVPRSVKRRSQWSSNLPRAIALRPWFEKSNRDETAICRERSHWYHNLQKVIVMTPLKEIVMYPVTCNCNRNELRELQDWPPEMPVSYDDGDQCKVDGDDDHLQLLVKNQVELWSKLNNQTVVNCRWQDVCCGPQQIEIAIGTVWKLTNQQNGFIKSEQARQ